MKITTWNVNSIRSRLGAAKQIIDNLQPDILCLQETKVTDDLFPHEFFTTHGYTYQIIHGQASYNGVAIVSKIPFIKQERIPFKKEARHLAIRIKDIEIHNFYVPAGGDIPDIKLNKKFADKLEFMDSISEWFKNNKKSNHKIIVLGDLNIAPSEQDVWSHKQLLKVVSHTPVEIEKYCSFQQTLNFFDANRHFISEEEKLYSWWSYRNRDWKNSDRGRRLDHILLTEPLKAYLKFANIFKEARDYESPSDHVPVSIKINF